MKSIQSKMWLLLAIIGLFFQSCQKDEDLTDELPVTLESNVNSDNRNGDGRGGDGRGNDIAGLDNDLVFDWTKLLLELDRYATGMRPNATARALAYIHLATYETAVPGMRRYRSNDNRLQGLRIRNEERARNVDYQIALNACYADVLDHFMINVPDNVKAQIATLEAAKEGELAGNQSNRLVEDSKQWGEYVAKQVIEYSQTDDEAEAQILEPQPLSYEPPTGDGFWTYSADPERALFPFWESVRTFVIGADETTTLPPIPYSEDANSPYFQEMMEVYNVNNTAKAEDNEDLWIAEFWSDDVEGLMMSPPGRQFSIANQLIQQYVLDLESTLVLYLKLGFSLNDAAVSTWKYKYEHMVMRPNVYIHEHIDPDFQTNLYRLIYWPNPSFPGYPSGHSCFASAAAGIFIDIFGNGTDFTDRSHEGRQEFRGEPRTFSSFADMAEENAFSRIPLGVHIRMDCAEGLRLGYEISDAVNDLNLRRNPN